MHPLLGSCVAALALQLGRSDEVLVVANGPEAERAKSEVDRSTNRQTVRVLTDAAVGLARARNRAVREASGDVVLFVDDDARPEAELVETYRAAFANDPSLAAAGGPIRLEWPTGTAPAWFHPALAPYYSALDLGPEPTPLDRGALPFGANFALRRSAVELLGLAFEPSLGRRGTDLGGGEESDLLERIRRAGGLIVWVPAAGVTHIVGRERARIRWLLRRAFAQGRTDVRFHSGGTRSSALASAVLRGWRALAAELKAGEVPRRAALTRDASRRARHLGRAWEFRRRTTPRSNSS